MHTYLVFVFICFPANMLWMCGGRGGSMRVASSTVCNTYDGKRNLWMVSYNQTKRKYVREIEHKIFPPNLQMLAQVNF